MTAHATTGEAASGLTPREVEFLSVLAHDLRQPLSVVIGMAVLLEQRWEDLSDAEKRAHVNLICRSAKWMKAMVDDLRAASEASDPSHMHPVTFSLPALVRETIADLEPTVRDRLTLVADDSLPSGYGDPVKQRQVLQNLLDNAVKYSGSSTPIDVGITARAETLAVTVADRGLGIPRDDVPTIFDKFMRVTDVDHADVAEGSGLGLFICRAMVNAQGGEINVARNTGSVGSVFTYTMPIAQLTPAVAPPDPAGAAASPAAGSPAAR